MDWQQGLLVGFGVWAAFILYGFWKHRKWFINWCNDWWDQMKWTWENAPKVAKMQKEVMKSMQEAMQNAQGSDLSDKNDKEVIKDAEFKAIHDKN